MPVIITVVSGQQVLAEGKGAMRCVNEAAQAIKLTDGLYVPQLDRKLVSVPAFGVVMQFEHNQAMLVVDGEVLDRIHRNISCSCDIYSS
ncbi:hypothetical protein Plhal304r1_c077g0164131 [Plasmopara halstedii]